MDINLDAPSAVDIDLAPAAPVTDPAKVAAQPAGDPAKPAPQPDKPALDPDRVIELSRTAREEGRKAREATGRVSELEAQVKRIEPLAELLKLGETDPLAAITEFADIWGFTPERMLEMIQTHGAGGEVALTPEDKIARLERQLDELRAPKKPEAEAKPDAGADQARQRELDLAGATLEASAEQYPLCSEETSAAEAAFLVRVRHWETHGRDAEGKTKADYKPVSYSQALAAVEKTLRAEVERKAGRIGLKSTPAAAGNPTTPANSGGLSNKTMGAVVPVDLDRALPDDVIRDEMLRQLGG